MNAAMPPEGPRHRPLPDMVAAHVREQIMSGAIRPGEFLRMEPIADAVGVSITPVREGLVRLTNEGFVTAVPRRGFVVAEFTRRDVRDLFWAQSRLAGELAARAADRITVDELDEFSGLMTMSDAAIASGDPVAIGEYGHRLHRHVNLVARSDRLARMLASIVKHLPNSFYGSIEAHIRTVPADHRDLYAALAAHDAERARAVTERHTLGSADYVVEMLEGRGLWGDDR